MSRSQEQRGEAGELGGVRPAARVRESSGTGLEALLGSLSERADVRGREFERVCGWFLCNAPEYRGLVRRVWLWDEWPGRWAADAGIDLVAETEEGALWAVQAKAYDPAYTIKKADVDSFLSESARAEFSYRLLIATTDRIGATARRTLAGQEKPASALLRSQLALTEVAWPSSPADLRPPPQSRKRARPYQQKAVAAVTDGFRSNARGQLVMACGTGKTLAACFLAEELVAGRVLVLVPSLSLLAQTLREWASASEFSYLAVCSDETVTGEQTDAVVSSTSELGFPVTTDPAVIARFLRGRGKRTRVVFATYQSSPRVAEAQAARTPAFDLVIADEAHRCAGPQAGVFATVLDAGKIKARKRVFMTATPRFFTGRVRREAREAEWEIASMDDESQFGPVLHRLSFAEAIEQRLLSDYQVAVVGVSDATYREYAERGVFVTADGEQITDARTLASQLGLLRAMANYDLRRVVTFHSRIRNASGFARSLPEVCAWLPTDRRPTGALWAEHVSGEMTSGERDNRLNRLRAISDEERAVISNARCLAEGVDVPTLDAVAFIEPRRSQIDVVQAVGRAIRKAEDKTIGTVVIPVFVDANADPEQALESGEFNRVWDVVKALRAHDEVLAEELDELRRELGRRTTRLGRPRKISLDLPVEVGDAFVRAFDTKVVETSTASWEFWFGLLQEFGEREQHMQVPQAHVEDGYALGHWVAYQRQLQGSGGLSPDRASRLAALPGWDWSTQDSAWEDGYACLERFAARERHTRVERQHVEEGHRLGIWVRNQRNKYAAGRLSPERATRLAALPGWQWNVKDADWEEAFSRLERFAAREHHTHVPDRHIEDGYRLGVWARNQRAAHAMGRLSAERAALLAALPDWDWGSALDAAWEKGFSHLERFAARKRHTRVPATHVEDGYRLGQWVSNQRTKHRASRLPAHLASRLQALPGWDWNPIDAKWEEGFSRLKQFAAREHHTHVPTRYVEDGYRLGEWASKQRAAYRAGRLSQERAARLEALPGWSATAEDAAWENGFSRLEHFVRREQHTRLSKWHVEDGFRLGGWLERQRAAHRAGGLSQERTARLEALPGWKWMNSRDAAWEEGFARLERFSAREHHTRVPQTHMESGYQLGQWVSKQRAAYRSGRLTEERRNRLAKLSGWVWNTRKSPPES